MSNLSILSGGDPIASVLITAGVTLLVILAGLSLILVVGMLFTMPFHTTGVKYICHRQTTHAALPPERCPRCGWGLG